MKILSINDFINKLSKLLRNLSKRVHLKCISKFLTDTVFVQGHLKTGPFTKIMSVNNFVNKLANTL